MEKQYRMGDTHKHAHMGEREKMAKGIRLLVS